MAPEIGDGVRTFLARRLVREADGGIRAVNLSNRKTLWTFGSDGAKEWAVRHSRDAADQYRQAE